MMTDTDEIWFRAGLIERGPKYQAKPAGKARYKWRTGYAKLNPDNLIEYPWLTKREAQSAAKKRGNKIWFFYDRKSAENVLSVQQFIADEKASETKYLMDLAEE